MAFPAGLEQWLRGEGARFDALHIAVAPEVAGYAGYAVRHIAAGEEVISCPISLLMHARAALADAEVGRPLSELRARHGPKGVDNTFLVCIFLLYQRALGPTSRWAAYIASLPGPSEEWPESLTPSSLDATILWPEEQLRALLEGTAVYSATQRLREDIRRVHCELVGALARDAPGPFGDRAAYSELWLRWAYAIYWSRALRVNVHGEELGCLVPLVDVLNHDAASCAQLHATAAAYSLRAGRSVAPGAEVRISYGAKGSAELVQHYGFVLRDNPADVVCVELAESFGRTHGRAGGSTELARVRAAVRSARLPASHYLHGGSAGVAAELPHAMLEAARLLVCTADELDRLAAREEAARAAHDESSAGGSSSEAWHRWLAASLNEEPEHAGAGCATRDMDDDIGADPDVITLENEAAAMGAIVSTLEELRAGVGGTAASVAAALAKADAEVAGRCSALGSVGGTLPESAAARRTQMALVYRLGQHRVLDANLQLLRSRQARVHRALGPSGSAEAFSARYGHGPSPQPPLSIAAVAASSSTNANGEPAREVMVCAPAGAPAAAQPKAAEQADPLDQAVADTVGQKKRARTCQPPTTGSD